MGSAGLFDGFFAIQADLTALNANKFGCLGALLKALNYFPIETQRRRAV